MYCTGWNGDGEVSENWDGIEGCQSSDTLGMRLDLDEGKLTVYKNNRRLGVMKDGLCGPYCWCATVWHFLQFQSK